MKYLLILTVLLVACQPVSQYVAEPEPPEVPTPIEQEPPQEPMKPETKCIDGSDADEGTCQYIGILIEYGSSLRDLTIGEGLEYHDYVCRKDSCQDLSDYEDNTGLIEIQVKDKEDALNFLIDNRFFELENEITYPADLTEPEIGYRIHVAINGVDVKTVIFQTTSGELENHAQFSAIVDYFNNFYETRNIE